MIRRRGTQPWRVSNFPEEPHRGAVLPPRLHQDVEDVAVLIHSAPQILLPTIDRHEELVEMPCVAELPAAVAESSDTRLESADEGESSTHKGQELSVGQRLAFSLRIRVVVVLLRVAVNVFELLKLGPNLIVAGVGR